MDKAQALDAFWSAFGLPAYEENAVPDNATFPRITYNASFASLDEPVSLSASLWYRSSKWEEAQIKAQEISGEIGRGGKVVPFDGGGLWITRGTPFAQNLADPDDDMIRRVYLNLSGEYFSAD